MSEYLVRWKFGPNSLLNNDHVETQWYQHIYPSKAKAVDQYTSLLYNSSPSMAITVEIFQLVKLVPGQPEPEEQKKPLTIDELLATVPEKPNLEARNKQFVKDFNKGLTRKQISEKHNVSYQTVCNVIRQASE